MSGSGRLFAALGGGRFEHVGIWTVTDRPGCLTDWQGFHPHHGQTVAIQVGEWSGGAVGITVLAGGGREGGFGYVLEIR